jgi:hypothetical protein
LQVGDELGLFPRRQVGDGRAQRGDGIRRRLLGSVRVLLDRLLELNKGLLRAGARVTFAGRDGGSLSRGENRKSKDGIR